MRDKINILKAFNNGRKKSKEAEEKYWIEIIEIMIEDGLLNNQNSTGGIIITSRWKEFLKEYSNNFNRFNYYLKYYSPSTTFIMWLITWAIIPIVLFLLNQPK